MITNEIANRPFRRTMSRLQCPNLKSVLRRIITAREFVTQDIYRRSKSNNWGTKKSVTYVKIIHYPVEGMADPQVEQILAPLRAAVKKQVSDLTMVVSSYFTTLV